MAGSWGSKKNGVRIGVFWSGIEFNSDGSQARITSAVVKIDRDGNIVDTTNKLSVSGSAVTDDSWSNLNCSGSGSETIKSVAEQWQTLNYGSTKTATFSASLSGIDHAGGTLTASDTVTFPARDYDFPTAPTNVALSKVSNSSYTVSWTNTNTTAAPYENMYLMQWDSVGQTWTQIATASGATLTNPYTVSGLDVTIRYKWRIDVSGSNSQGIVLVSSAETALTDIPLTSMSLSASSVAIGSTVTMTLTKSTSTYSTTIRWQYGSNSGTIYTGTETSYAWTIPTSIGNYLPSSTSGSFTIIVDTYNGTTLLGSLTYSMTITVPSAAPFLPTLDPPTHYEGVAEIAAAGFGVYLQNKSAVHMVFPATYAAGSGATVTKREVFISGNYYDVTTGGDQPIWSIWSTDQILYARITDSRGRVTTSAGVTLKMGAYTSPTIMTFTGFRSDSGGTASSAGTYLKLNISVSAGSINDGVSEKNTLAYSVSSSPTAGSNPLNSSAVSSTLTKTATPVVGSGLFATNTSYVITLTVSDKLTTVTRTLTIPTEIVPLSIGPAGIALGKVFNNGNYVLDAVGDVKVTGNLTYTGTLTGTLPSHTHTLSQISDFPTAVSATELGYLDGVTSAIQTQLNGKQASGSYAAAVHNHTLSQITDYPTAKARMTKTSQSPTYSSNTWTRVTDFATTDYNSGFTVDLTNGAFTIPATGYYDISFRQRWQSYGSVYIRAGAIVNGTSAPATDASNVLDISVFEHAGWLIVPQVVKSVPLTSGDVITFWIRSATVSTFNATNTSIPGWTSVAITKV